MEKELKKLMKANKTLFWDISEEALNGLSQNAVVTRIVEYGDMGSFKKLVDLNADLLKDLANSQMHKGRVNLSKRIINFINTYFEYNS